MLASIVIRTLNEEKHLGELLSAIGRQMTDDLDHEVILVDSGSEDRTLEIAVDHGCKILHITREEFSFGRALNMGCEGASGDFLVIISGHCIPTDEYWLQKLCKPLMEDEATYSYGRQIGASSSRYSERRIFAKYYPEESKIPQEGFFCNNANSAIKRASWGKQKFDEDLTGLEDMELAQRLVTNGDKIAYVAEASVYHLHEETWGQVKRRFEREAIALQKIMPQVHIHIQDLIRYIASSIWLDWKGALSDKVFLTKAIEIVQYRFLQYWGSFVGNHDHRKLSHAQKEAYFYPNDSRSKYEPESRRALADESQQ
jgi:glycosyltransferase involved in cell wall biosynthesis